MSARLVIADDSATILALVTLAVKKDGYEPALNRTYTDPIIGTAGVEAPLPDT